MMYRTLLTGICSAALATLALAGSNQSSLSSLMESAATVEALSLDLAMEAPADRGVIGVTLSDEGGAPGILEVFDESPAEKAGLKSGDKIVSINGRKIGSLDALVEVLAKRKAGDRIKVGVERDGWRKDVKVVLASPNGIAEFDELEAEEHEHEHGAEKAEAAAKQAKAAARKAANAQKKAAAKKKAVLKKKAAAEKKAARARNKKKATAAVRLQPAVKTKVAAKACDSAETCDSASSCSSAATCDSATSCESKVDQKVVAQLSALGYVCGTDAPTGSSGSNCPSGAAASSCSSGKVASFCSSGGSCSSGKAASSCSSGGDSCSSGGSCSSDKAASSCSSGGSCSSGDAASSCSSGKAASSCSSGGSCSSGDAASSCSSGKAASSCSSGGDSCSGTATTPCADGCACVEAPKAQGKRIGGAQAFVISDGGGARVIELKDLGVDAIGLQQFVTATEKDGQIKCEIRVRGVGEGGQVLDFTQGCEDEDVVISPGGERTLTRTFTLGGGSCCDEPDVQKRVQRKVIRFGGGSGDAPECQIQCKMIKVGVEKECASECEIEFEIECDDARGGDTKLDIRRNKIFHLSSDESGEQGGHQVWITGEGGEKAMIVLGGIGEVDGHEGLPRFHGNDFEALHGAHGAHGMKVLRGVHGEQDGPHAITFGWVAGDDDCCGNCDDDDDDCEGDCDDCEGDCDDCEGASDFFFGNAGARRGVRIRRPADVRFGTTPDVRRRVEPRRGGDRDALIERPHGAREGANPPHAQLAALRQELAALRAEIRELRQILKKAHR